MKVLFVCSGNSNFFRIAPFIKSQAESIRHKGINVECFRIKGKGIWGYLKNIILLREHLNKHQYDIIHAHYALCGLVVVLSSPNLPIVLSYMGSDVYGDCKKNGKRKISSYVNIFIARLLQSHVNWIIVKSPNLFKHIQRKEKATIIPNGIDFKRFVPISRYDAREYLGLEQNKKVILFLGNPKNTRKNFSLMKNAVDSLDIENIELMTPFPIPHEMVSLYLNCCNVLVLTSYMEGSPNAVKEAMACNVPVVATDVGDVKYLFDGIPGYYIVSFDASDIAHKIKLALEMSKRPQGRQRLASLGLDSETVAEKVIEIYEFLQK